MFEMFLALQGAPRPKSESHEDSDPDQQERAATSAVHTTRLRSAARAQRKKARGLPTGTDSQWEDMYSRLSAFAKAHGNCSVPVLYRGQETLSRWCTEQRYFHKHNRLAPIRVRRLDAIGFSWTPVETRWERLWARLQEFKREYGHCRVTPALARATRYQGLRKWTQWQRELKRANKLEKERAARLEALGFEWDLSEVPWEDKYTAVLMYQKKHGNGSFPLHGSPETALVAWLEKQRANYHQETLDRKKARRLEGLGMDWAPHETKYHQMLRALRRFRKKHGHCNIRRSDPENHALASYVGYVRALKRKGQLAPAKVAQLENVGLRWNATQAYYDGMWDRMLKQLAAYKRLHGHCDVPIRSSSGRALGEWVGKQRRRKEEGELSAAQQRALEALGITWRIRENAWDQHYEALGRFAKAHRHCRITKRTRKAPGSLYRWVFGQRHLRKNKRLDQERVAYLEKLGFEWSTDVAKRRVPQG